MGYACGMGLMALVCTILGYYSESIFRMFETDPQQISKLKKCMWVILVIIMLQASYGILAGVVKGLGLQNRASLITAICHFAIALPLAVFLGTSAVQFFSWQDRKYLGQIHDALGFNLGYMLGLLVLNVSMFYLVCSVSWQKTSKCLTVYF